MAASNRDRTHRARERPRAGASVDRAWLLALAGCGRLSFGPLAGDLASADAALADGALADDAVPPGACPRPIAEASPTSSLDLTGFAYVPGGSTSWGPAGLFVRSDGTMLYYCDTF